ncbi:MAG: hypothetical protein ACTHU0_28295 [Kofleriaceae bacterium]
MRVALVVSLFATACGDDGIHHLPDAPPAPDAPQGAVTLTITRGRAPRPGIEVHFQNADSSLVSTVRTDENGVATAEMVAGGYVTAVSPFDEPGQADPVLFSYAGVQPGDALKLQAARDPELIEVNVRLQRTSGGAGYVLHTSCNNVRYDFPDNAGSANPLGGRIQIPGCPTTDMLVEAYGADGIPTRYMYASDVPLVAGEWANPWKGDYLAMSDVTYTYQHLPEGLGDVFAITSLMDDTGMSRVRLLVVPAENRTAVTTEKRPKVSGVRQLVTSEIITGGVGIHYIDDWGPVDDYTLDVDDALLREYATPPLFDATSRTLSWSTLPSGLAPDLANARLRFSRSATEAWRWIILSPLGTTDEVKFPVLPGDAQAFNPIESDAVDYEVLTTAKVPGGYDAARPVYFSDRITGVMRPASGRIVRQSLELTLATRAGRTWDWPGMSAPMRAR